MILVLNMMEAVKQRGIKIDCEMIAQKLQSTVVAIFAVTGSGIDQFLLLLMKPVRWHPHQVFILIMHHRA